MDTKQQLSQQNLYQTSRVGAFKKWVKQMCWSSGAAFFLFWFGIVGLLLRLVYPDTRCTRAFTFEGWLYVSSYFSGRLPFIALLIFLVTVFYLLSLRESKKAIDAHRFGFATLVRILLWGLLIVYAVPALTLSILESAYPHAGHVTMAGLFIIAAGPLFLVFIYFPIALLAYIYYRLALNRQKVLDRLFIVTLAIGLVLSLFHVIRAVQFNCGDGSSFHPLNPQIYHRNQTPPPNRKY